jgi:hypothetical protein
MRRVLVLALFGMMAVSQSFSYQGIEAVSSKPIVATDQAQYPPPPECGLYDTCKGEKR